MNLSAFLGSGIKSIQRGTISVASSSSATATITAVNTAKTELRYLGAAGFNSARIALTNSTTVTATNAGGATVVVGFEVTERY